MTCGECMHLIHVRERRRCLLAMIRSADCRALHEPREECSIGEVNILVILRFLSRRPAR